MKFAHRDGNGSGQYDLGHFESVPTGHELDRAWPMGHELFFVEFRFCFLSHLRSQGAPLIDLSFFSICA